MELRQLEYYVSVVENGNISAAAKVLNLSQPPLSRQIHLLEEELGVQLLVRGPRQVTRTEAGRIFYEKAKTLLALAEDTRQELWGVAAGRQGRISLGVISSSGNTGITQAIAAFHRDYPQVRFRVWDRTSFDLVELVQNGVVDLAVVRGPLHTEGLESVRLLEETLVVLGDEHFFAGLPAGDLHFSDMEALPLLLPRRVIALWDDARKGDGRWNEVASFDDTRTAVLWARAGMGVTLVPRSIAELFGVGLCCRDFDEPDMASVILAVWRADAVLPLAAQNLLPYLYEYLGRKGNEEA